MDIYGADNGLYGLIGRPNITVVQQQPDVKEIKLHFNDDDEEMKYDSNYGNVSVKEEVSDNTRVKNDAEESTTQHEQNLQDSESSGTSPHDSQSDNSFVDLNYVNQGADVKRERIDKLLQYRIGGAVNNAGNNVVKVPNDNNNSTLGLYDNGEGNEPKQYQVLEDKGLIVAVDNKKQDALNNGYLSPQQHLNLTGISQSVPSSNSNDGSNFEFQQPPVLVSNNNNNQQPFHLPNGLVFQPSDQNFQGTPSNGVTKSNLKSKGGKRQMNKDEKKGLDMVVNTAAVVVDTPLTKLEPEADAEVSDFRCLILRNKVIYFY